MAGKRGPYGPRIKRPFPKWRIYREVGGAKIYVGMIEARNQARAIDLAIVTFFIDPEHHEHLIAELRD
jgi:hypothetical protein